MVPSPFDRPAGCGFHPRCDHAIKGICDQREPDEVPLGPNRGARCVLLEHGFHEDRARMAADA
jgi:peptide/nickel transport system ATP-binding protein